jgi:hypothetical protein
MKLKVIILALVCGLFLLPLVAGAEQLPTGAEELLLAAGGDSAVPSEEEAGLSFTDISMIVMIILVTIYFAALYVKEWRQVR